MIDWEIIVKLIDYDFDCIGVHSTLDYEHPEYGELSYQWRGNKSFIEIIFIDTCVNCICIKTGDIGKDMVNCDCDWDAFQESNWSSKIYTKKQVFNIKKQHKINFNETKK